MIGPQLSPNRSADSRVSDAYLDLLTDTLLGLNWDDGTRPVAPGTIRNPLKRWATSMISRRLARYGISLSHRHRDWEKERESGRDWPDRACTMIGKKRLDHLRHAALTVIEEEIPGDFLETGVWRGGACILLRGVLRAVRDENRTVWCADSFCGLPRPTEDADDGDEHWTKDELAVDLDSVKDNFRRFDLLDDRVQFLPGWFHETLPKAPIEQLAILRLDGDMYSSTMDALRATYSKVSPGGFVIVDDYGHPPAQQACQEYLSSIGQAPTIEMIDHIGAYWRTPH